MKRWLELWIAFVVGVIMGLTLGMWLSTPVETPAGRACYQEQLVHPFSAGRDTVDVSICFRY